jgi:hypothetical protein
MAYKIGPIRYRNIPVRLQHYFEEFAVELACKVQKEFSLLEKPVVEATFSNTGRVEALLHAPLVGFEYGRLLVMVTKALHDFAEGKGIPISEIMAA